MNKYLALWESLPPDDETKGFVYREGDLFHIIDGYLFIVETENGCNNIIFKKFKEPTKTLRQVFDEFRLWLIDHNILFLRIEGSLARYKFLQRMFPADMFIRDEDVLTRNVYYVKINIWSNN